MFVHLHNVRFHGFHGLYETEKLVGGDFLVDLSVGFEPSVEVVTHIEQTVDYTRLHHIVQEKMSVPTPLLETLATEIVATIREQFTGVSKISISIKKLHPPVNNFQGSLGVSFEWSK